MTSEYVITWRATFTGDSVMQFTSQSQRQLFANDITGTVRNEPCHGWGVTKTGGLSNVMGAKRSMGGNSDTVTHMMHINL